MQKKDTWLLPQGIEDVLPEDAKQLELLRRQLLDVFACWGYELVIPPVIDFLDSLMTGSGRDLDLQTFKLTDQISGEMLGIHADMTPQVARIDAHNLKYERPTRLCYVGTILKALGDSLEKSRSPMQIGAEIYGHSGLESDFEVIQLMLEMLAVTGIENVHLDLGHVGIYRALSEEAGLTKEQEAELFDVLQRKAITELNELVNGYKIDDKFKHIFITLPALNGGVDILVEAAKVLSGVSDSVTRDLEELKTIADKLSLYFPSLPVSFDLSELRGYHYHTGLVFAAFIPKLGREIARGGRYDNIGEFFGRARAATGFSADLKLLSSLSLYAKNSLPQQLIYAPFVEDSVLVEKVRDLRAEGIAVIQQLPGHPDEINELACTDRLEKENQTWVVKPLS
jgi:ATP phosphoribosyltransferase regulatory subunit